jgi:lipoprotein-anchoring transpeptidase ErfK/SrfK
MTTITQARKDALAAAVAQRTALQAYAATLETERARITAAIDEAAAAIEHLDHLPALNGSGSPAKPAVKAPAKKATAKKATAKKATAKKATAKKATATSGTAVTADQVTDALTKLGGIATTVELAAELGLDSARTLSGVRSAGAADGRWSATKGIWTLAS